MSAEHQVRYLATPQIGSPRYRFRDDIWEHLSSLMAWPNTLTAAKALGISDTTITRALRGETFPGEVLMARLMNALPRHVKFDHVFELVLVDGDAQVPA